VVAVAYYAVAAWLCKLEFSSVIFAFSLKQYAVYGLRYQH
jgi:hypothetical protein